MQRRIQEDACCMLTGYLLDGGQAPAEAGASELVFALGKGLVRFVTELLQNTNPGLVSRRPATMP